MSLRERILLEEATVALEEGIRKLRELRELTRNHHVHNAATFASDAMRGARRGLRVVIEDLEAELAKQGPPS